MSLGFFALLLFLCVVSDARTSSRQPLRPRDLPTFPNFSNWSSPEQFVYKHGYGRQGQLVSHGAIRQTGSSSSFSEFHLLHKVVEEGEAIAILALLHGHKTRRQKTAVPLDDDPDSVDGMTAHELFLDNLELRQGRPSKPEWNSRKAPAELQSRASLQRRVRNITDPILHERLTPFVRQQFPSVCGGDASSERLCTPCFSLLRRYVGDERTSHSIHHDDHALVTVVVGLSVRGEDYNGGLFVATNRAQQQYVGLTRGDAVVHQGDLLHGVKVLPANPQKGHKHSILPRMERWSWILWYRDSTSCEDHGHEWFRECAEEGSPTCELLYSSKEKTDNLPPSKVFEHKLEWTRRASMHGHTDASIKLARAHLKILPSYLPYNESAAKELYISAIESSNHPDAHYGLASLLIQSAGLGKPVQPGHAKLKRAVQHLESAAKQGHPFASFNLGVAYMHGLGMPQGRKNSYVAGEWFEYSGLPEGLFAKALQLWSVGKEEEARAFEKRAKSLGFGSPWRKIARDRTGVGGTGGIDLNMDWPQLTNGEEPIKW
jgi:hypothetical protein